jgi:hypothetical protein
MLSCVVPGGNVQNALAGRAVTQRRAYRYQTPHYSEARSLEVATTHHSVMKRSREEEDGPEHPAKVRRVSNSDRLSRLSDELLVRILSFLPVSSLVTSQR